MNFNDGKENRARKPKVLFLCTGNSARSQMAEALLRHHAGERFEVHSAGLEPKGIHPLTVKVLEERGLDISGQSSKDVETYLAKISFAHVVTVCGEADENCPTALLHMGKKQHWPLEDPAKFVGTEGEKLERFRAVRDEIEGHIVRWLDGMSSGQ